MLPAKKRSQTNNIKNTRIIKHKLWKFKQYINSIENDNLLSKVTIIIEHLEMSSLSVLQNNGNELRLNLNDNIRQRIYKIILNRLTPLCTSDDAFDELIEEIKRRLKG